MAGIHFVAHIHSPDLPFVPIVILRELAVFAAASCPFPNKPNESPFHARLKKSGVASEERGVLPI